MTRHSDYTEEIADEICERLANGESLRTICDEEPFPHRNTVRRWLIQFPAFRAQYALARVEQADSIFDEILDIADDSRNDWMAVRGKDDVGYQLNSDHVRRAQVRIDARKWMAGKLAPKKYGDKTLVETNATVKVEHTRRLDISTLTDEQLDALEGALRATVAQLDGPVIEHEE